MLGIIGAMDVEVKKLREMMEDPEIQTVAGMTFYQGTIKGKAVVVVRSGIGKVNAGLCSQILVDRYHVSGIINTGIDGTASAEDKIPSKTEIKGLRIIPRKEATVITAVHSARILSPGIQTADCLSARQSAQRFLRNWIRIT